MNSLVKLVWNTLNRLFISRRTILSNAMVHEFTCEISLEYPKLTIYFQTNHSLQWYMNSLVKFVWNTLFTNKPFSPMVHEFTGEICLEYPIYQRTILSNGTWIHLWNLFGIPWKKNIQLSQCYQKLFLKLNSKTTGRIFKCIFFKLLYSSSPTYFYFVLIFVVLGLTKLLAFEILEDQQTNINKHERLGI